MAFCLLKTQVSMLRRVDSKFDPISPTQPNLGAASSRISSHSDDFRLHLVLHRAERPHWIIGGGAYVRQAIARKASRDTNNHSGHPQRVRDFQSARLHASAM